MRLFNSKDLNLAYVVCRGDFLPLCYLRMPFIFVNNISFLKLLPWNFRRQGLIEPRTVWSQNLMFSCLDLRSYLKAKWSKSLPSDRNFLSYPNFAAVFKATVDQPMASKHLRELRKIYSNYSGRCRSVKKKHLPACGTTFLRDFFSVCRTEPRSVSRKACPSPEFNYRSKKDPTRNRSK